MAISSSSSHSVKYSNEKYAHGYFIVSQSDKCSFRNLDKSNKGDVPVTGKLSKICDTVGNRFKDADQQNSEIHVDISRADIRDFHHQPISSVTTTKNSLTSFFENTIKKNSQPNQYTKTSINEAAKLAFEYCDIQLLKDVLNVHFALVTLVKDPFVMHSLPTTLSEFARMVDTYGLSD